MKEVFGMEYSIPVELARSRAFMTGSPARMQLDLLTPLTPLMISDTKSSNRLDGSFLLVSDGIF